MVRSLRLPFFVIAIVLMLLALTAELAAPLIYESADGPGLNLPPPGRGIPGMALLDGLLCFTVALIGVALIAGGRVHGRVQGVATLVVSLLVLLAAIAQAMESLRLLKVMTSLLMTVPFGPIEYFEEYADFDVKTARRLLSTVMTLKVFFVVALLLAQQRFVENKGLVLIVITSFVVTIVVTYLHGLVPRVFVSITDDIGAIIAALAAAVWAILLLIGSIPAVLRALRADRAIE